MSRHRIVLALAAAYLVLLAASHLIRARAREPVTPLTAHALAVEIGNRVRMAYRDLRSPTSDLATTVLLLHGSPGSSDDFATLAPALAARYRVVVPDLPGFGDSSRRAPDYSIRSHAGAALQLLDRLELETVHVLGFSMGGGVALEMVRQQPRRVRSLTLLSAIGVQELELLGSYRLNHAVHGLQLALIWLLHEATPHFGALDGFPLDLPYARNFYDTDQRPLRAALRSIEVPTLILHGERDVLVPVAAALEHHRLVPQSELVLFDADHFFVFRHGDRIATSLIEFLDRVESGGATSRAGAEPRRLVRAAESFAAHGPPQARGIGLAVLMLLLALATLVSEDLASIGTGLLVAQGRLGFFAGAVACFAGILLGDVAIYLGGRVLGRPWLRRAPVRWLVRPAAVERGERWFRDRGARVVFASRFLPGTRVATYFAAGVLGAGFWRFAGALAVAVAIWVPALVGLSALVGARVFTAFDAFARFALPGVAALAILGWLALRLFRTAATRRGRRLLVGRWRRLSHWEFWPPWAVYPPVVARILGFALTHRHPTAFTAANPAMPAAGFVGESKARILASLPAASVARFTLVPSELPPTERIAAAHEFMARHQLALPLVLKPDVGQRGRGVLVARDEAAIETYLAEARADVLVQEYVEGPELGIFYARRPSERHGAIISITDKRLPEVRGDGCSTLAELVLEDRRAVAMAEVYFEALGPELGRVPSAGEAVRLIEVGTHCRGAVFLDGESYRTPELERAVDEISRAYEGFFFGRYDLRAPSYGSFRRGEHLRVLELNGVTSEVTHVYDPRYSIIDAWRALFSQWRLAFEIGSANIERGAETTPIRELVRMTLAHLGSSARNVAHPRE